MATMPPRSTRYKYRIEVHYNDAWRDVVGLADVHLEWGRGWMDNQRTYPGPRVAYRLVREDGKVMDDAPALDELSCGALPQAQGYQWPYIAGAAERALRRAFTDAVDKPVRVRLRELADGIRATINAGRGS